MEFGLPARNRSSTWKATVSNLQSLSETTEFLVAQDIVGWRQVLELMLSSLDRCLDVDHIQGN
jgi:hypothetical protein